MRLRIFSTLLSFFVCLSCFAQISSITTWGGGKMALVDSDMERSLDSYKNWVAMFEVDFNLVTSEDSARTAVVLNFRKTNDLAYLHIWNHLDSLNHGYLEQTLKSEFESKVFTWGYVTSDSLYVDFRLFPGLSPFHHYIVGDELIIEVNRLSEPFVVEFDKPKKVRFSPFGGKQDDLAGVWDLGPVLFVMQKSNHKVLSSFENKVEMLKEKERIGYVFMCDANSRKQKACLPFLYWVEGNELCFFSEKSTNSPKLMFRVPFELSEDGETFYIKLHKTATTMQTPKK